MRTQERFSSYHGSKGAIIGVYVIEDLLYCSKPYMFVSILYILLKNSEDPE